MRPETVAAPTVHEAILLAVEWAEAQDRVIEPNSFRYTGLTADGHTFWFTTYPKEKE